jgi:hypothetical protein
MARRFRPFRDDAVLVRQEILKLDFHASSIRRERPVVPGIGREFVEREPNGIGRKHLLERFPVDCDRRTIALPISHHPQA